MILFYSLIIEYMHNILSPVLCVTSFCHQVIPFNFRVKYRNSHFLSLY